MKEKHCQIQTLRNNQRFLLLALPRWQGLAVPINYSDIIESETATKNEESFIHDREFIGREPNISGLAIANNATGGWICDTVSTNNIVGNLEDFHPFKPGQHRYRFGCSDVKAMALL
jgi:hypothetical protein